jgi:hypothetical protein
MRQQTTTAITYGILALAGAVPMAMPAQLTPSSASASSQTAATAQTTCTTDAATTDVTPAGALTPQAHRHAPPCTVRPLTSSEPTQ